MSRDILETGTAYRITTLTHSHKSSFQFIHLPSSGLLCDVVLRYAVPGGARVVAESVVFGAVRPPIVTCVFLSRVVFNTPDARRPSSALVDSRRILFYSRWAHPATINTINT